MYDTIIIGAGAAGLTSAIYNSRKRMKTLIISMDVGGQTNQTSDIQNYPAFQSIAGWDLMQKFQQHALSFGAELVMGRVTKVEKADPGFVVSTSEKDYQAKTLILAMGRTSRRLGVSGEDKFFGKGVHTCTTCDAPLYNDKTVAVVGGGNSALEGAQELIKTGARKVYLIHRRDSFRADEITVGEIKNDPKIELVLNSIVIQIKGERFVNEILVKDVNTEDTRSIKVDGVFLEIGAIADSSVVKHIVNVNEKGEIIVDRDTKTSCEGIFAAGDITDTKYKQTVISAGEGAKAALMVYRFLHTGKAEPIDW